MFTRSRTFADTWLACSDIERFSSVIFRLGPVHSILSWASGTGLRESNLGLREAAYGRFDLCFLFLLRLRCLFFFSPSACSLSFPWTSNCGLIESNGLSPTHGRFAWLREIGSCREVASSGQLIFYTGVRSKQGVQIDLNDIW